MRSVAIDPEKLRDCFGTFPVGVTVVTTVDSEDRLWGITASSFTAISMSPPIISVALITETPSNRALAESSEFAVSVLCDSQADIARAFATPAPDKFDGVDLDTSVSSSPLIAGASAWFVCRPVDAVTVGDHTVLLGEIIECGARDLPPLAYQRGAFYTLAAHTDATGGMYRRRRGWVAFIVESESRIALVRDHQHGGWNLPGGPILDGDSIDESLRATATAAVGTETKPDFLYSVTDLDDRLMCNVYRGRLEHSPVPHPGVHWFSETDLPWDQLSSKALEIILRRYFRERVADQFGVFVSIDGGRIASINIETEWVPGTGQTRQR